MYVNTVGLDSDTAVYGNFVSQCCKSLQDFPLYLRSSICRGIIPYNNNSQENEYYSYHWVEKTQTSVIEQLDSQELDYIIYKYNEFKMQRNKQRRLSM